MLWIITTVFIEIQLSFMQVNGKKRIYWSVQLWYLNYMQKEGKMPSKGVCVCINTMQKHNVLLSIVHLKIKAHLTAVTQFALVWVQGEGMIIGIIEWLRIMVVFMPAASKLPFTWCVLGEAMEEDSLGKEKWERDFSKHLKSRTPHGKFAYLTCLAGFVRMMALACEEWGGIKGRAWRV